MIRNFYLTTLFLSFFFTASLTAQNFPYFFSIGQEPYEEIEGTDLVNDVWDDPEFEVPIGFDFEFFGSTISTLYQVDLGSGLSGSNDLYDPGFDLFFVYGSDIIDRGVNDGTQLSKISYVTEGTPGSQICKIEWKNVGFYEDPTPTGPLATFINFQAWFYEGSNDIEVRFGSSNITEADSILHNFNGDPLIGFVENIDANSYQIDGVWFLQGDEASATVEFTDDFYAFEEESLLSSEPIDGRVYRFTTSPFVSAKEPLLAKVVKVYPNVAMDYTNVNIQQQKITTGNIQLFNNLGQLISQQDAHAGIQQVDLSAVPQGSYFLRIQIDDEEFSQMIVKQ